MKKLTTICLFLIIIVPIKMAFTTHAEEYTSQKSIVISEIAATEISSLEWIEIQNISDKNINIEGWKFFEGNANHGLTIFQGGFDMKANEIAIIANKAEQLKEKYPLLENSIFDSSWSSLKEAGEEIGIKNNDSQFIELFTYIPSTENTLQRIDLEMNDYSETNWINYPHSIGKENLTLETSVAEDVGIVERIDITVVDILEIPATPDIKAATPDIESTEEVKQHATSKSKQESITSKPNAIISIQSGVTKAQEKVTINLDGTKSTDPYGQKLTYYWDFGDGYTYENKNPPSHSFKEAGTYIITLRVTNKDNLFDETTIDITVMEKQEVTDKKNTKKTEVLKNTNLNTHIQKEKEISPTKEPTNAEGGDNSKVEKAPQAYPTIILNEVFPNPKGKDYGQEWIEIYNPNEFPVNIKDYVIDDYTEKGSAKMKLPEIEMLPKSTYLIFDPKINLNNSNEEIQILDPNGTLLDKIYFSEGFEDQSYARIRNEWLWTTFPTPNFTNEIISENLEITEKAEKDKKYKNGNLSSEIYISEILPNPMGEDAKGEWIELYNSGQSNINLGNWQIDDNENGSKPYTIPDNIVIKTKSYLVIQRSESKISLDNRKDKVRLFNFEEEMQDEIEYEKAKENLSFAKMEIIYEDKVEIDWTWTPKITQNSANPKLYKIRGEIDEKMNENIFIKAKELKLPQDNELDNLILSPGNLVELTYDDKNEIKDYTLIKEKFKDPVKTKKTNFEIIKIALIIIGVGGYIIIKKL